MNCSPLPSIDTATPDITVLDNRGLTIRLLRYCRSQAGQAAEERVEQQRYTPPSHLAARIDARFFAAGGQVCNFEHQHALSGQPLHTHSVDGGDSWQLSDIEGRPFWQRDARSTQQRFIYDVLGRLSQRREILDGGSEKVCERLIYGETQADADKRNLRGQLLHHYDTAGLLEHPQGFTLTGSPLQQTRRLLPVETASDWTQGDETQWQGKLEAAHYTTGWQHDLSGQLLTQTDASGHRQRLAYDVAGTLKASWVQLRGRPEQAVLKALCYSAAGQILSETAGNDVVTDYRYEPETQRLLGVTTTRPGQGERKTRLQQLRYEYDPVGNLTARHNDAEAVRFFKNQRVTASARYAYDSLYQLIEASGQENDHPDSQHDNPDTITPLDSVNLVNYTRRYQYDAGGNLSQIRHSGAQNHTRQLVVSANSNHALLKADGLTPDQVRSHFDACGNPRQLDNTNPLQWDSLNQLQSVITVARSANPDRECYCYSQGLRLRKTTMTQHGNVEQRQEVIYLPGLELRRTTKGSQASEQLEVLTIGEAGRSQVRLLNWVTGKPSDIANQQLRYSLDDLLGSSTLELDSNADILTLESYYPYGGTAVRAAKTQSEAKAKTVRYSGKERDATGLYYYGYRYYLPWLGRWLSPDPAGTVDGLNLFRMARNNPVTFLDAQGNSPISDKRLLATGKDRSMPGSIRSENSINYNKLLTFKVNKISQGDVLNEKSLSEKILVTDLLNPQKTTMDTEVIKTLKGKEGGVILPFQILEMSDDNSRSFYALKIKNPSERRSEGNNDPVEFGYWAPQGGSVDIPAVPEKGEPEYVFTPGFSGCSLVVDKIEGGKKLRVFHVEGGKEDEQYNNNKNRGDSMLGSMEYTDYGYHQQHEGETWIENIYGFAFMQFDRNSGSWVIKYQGIDAPPQIKKITSPPTLMMEGYGSPLSKVVKSATKALMKPTPHLSGG